MTNKSEEYVSSLLGAIDTVVGERLKQVAYDKTIICTIIDDSRAKNGEYRVTDGSVKFWAKCENTNYRTDEQVRVSIPNNDTTQEKFIIGKYVKDNNTTPITYMSPLDSVLQMSGNLFAGNNANSVYGFKANDSVKSTLLWSTNLSDNQVAMQANSIYDVIYLQAEFKCLLSHYSITSGTYGFVLSLGTTLSDGSAGPAINCVFDSTMMLGNPYAFGIFSKQAAKFDITNVHNISSIHLYFVQDGNFIHNTKGRPEDVPVNPEINNILVKNIQIGFGADLINVADQTVKLYTTDDLRFDNGVSIGNTKHLQIAWYNKDENGKYIGFDDAKLESGEIKFVDENAYLEKAREYESLKAQQNYDIPMDRTGLNLASKTAQIKTLMSELSITLSKDFYQLLRKFADRCNISYYKDVFIKLQDFVSEQTIVLAGDNDNTTTLSAAATDLYDWYMSALNHAAAIYNVNIIPTTIENSWTFAYTGELDSPEHNKAPDYLTAFTTYFNDLYDLFYPIVNEETQERRFLNDLYDLVTEEFTGYKGIYDDYNIRITKLFREIWSKWETVGNPTEKTKIEKETGKVIVTKPIGLLINNKNEIEAYFQKEKYHFEHWNEAEAKAELIADNNGYCVYWYRYDPASTGDNFMPRGWKRIENADNNNSGITVDLDATTMVKEEFQVAVFYNHEKYISNILTFENQSPVINNANALLSDRISINHGKNSQESYQSYSIANTLINGADRYRKRELEVQFTHYNGEVDDTALINAQIYWYVPKNATMLTFDTVDLQSLNKNNDFVNDITDISDTDTKSEYYRDGFTCFYKTIGYGLTEENLADYVNDLKFAYRIKDYYSPTSAQNTIICVVVKDNIKYEAEILMNFSSYGTSGTDYTLVVAPTQSQAAAVAGEAWELKIALYNNKNEQIAINSQPEVDFLFGDDASASYAYTISKEVYQKDNDALSWYVEIATDTSKTLCDILKASVEVTHGEPTEEQIGTTVVKATTYFPIPYSANTNYYIEGATTVVYDSQGNNPSYYKDPYKIYKQAMWNEAEAKWDTSVPEHTWKIYYTPGVSETASEKLKKAYDNVKAYLPRLLNDTLLPANMWVDGGDVTYDENFTETSHCAYIQCESGQDILWSQPILILQNRYPSPMVNAWDGKFKIDEKNGTIMSTMVGAGKKNTDNTFSGVLMGDVENAADMDNKTGLGIYGFNHGAQSFGLNVDGTAFFGKSGRGRILFDGNSGTISSASYNSPNVRVKKEDGTGYAASTAGMMIDLDDGFIDMLGGIKTIDEETGEVSYGTERTAEGAQSRVKISVQSPYFFIESKSGNRLLNIGDESDFIFATKENGKGYYLKTDNYLASSWQTDILPWTTGQGMLIDLAKGKIDAYDFTLRGENTTSRSYLKLSSETEEMIKVHYRDDALGADDEGLSVMQVGTTDYVLRSFNWWNVAEKDVPLTGMEIDIGKGKIQAYYENTANARNFICIDASDDGRNNPLSIGDRDTPAFQVAWDGSLKIADTFGVTAGGVLTATGATISGNITATTLEATQNGTIGGWTIGQSTLTGKNNITLNGETGTISGGTISGSTLSGMLGEIGGWKISGAILQSTNDKIVLDSAGSITVTDVCTIDSDGVAIKKGSISLGGENAGTPIFQVTDAGIVNITKGEISLGNNFKVTDTGEVTIREGNITLGGTVDKPVFSVNSSGIVNITQGSITLGENENFKVTDDGAVTIKQGSITLGTSDGKAVFEVTDLGKLTAIGATLKDLTIENALTVNVNGTSEFKGNMHITGDLKIDSKKIQIENAQGWGSQQKILVDVPFEKGIYITIHNGIITDVESAKEQSSFSKWLQKVFKFTGTGVPEESLGDLAFADYVSKKLNVTLKGSASVSYPGGGGGWVYIKVGKDGKYISASTSRAQSTDDYDVHSVYVNGASGGVKTVDVALSKTFTANFYPSESDDEEDFTYTGLTASVS